MTADTVGGVWTYALDLIRELPAEVTLATMGPPPRADQRAEAAAIPNLRLVESRFKLEWMEQPWDDVARAGEWLLEIDARFHPDLVHLNGYTHAALPWPVPVVVVAHSCVLSWWKAVHGIDAPAPWDRYRAEVAQGLAAADAVVCPTAAMLHTLSENYPDCGGARVIPNGRNSTGRAPDLKGEFVFAAGRLWDEAKNLQSLARVAPRLAWPVVAAGDTEATCDSLRLLGRLSSRELARWFASAPIYALPARYEPFGLSVLEAALCGCALVLGDIPSLRENWDRAALFVSPTSDTELEDALDSLIADPLCRARYSARALERARAFTPRRMAAAYMNLYRDLIAQEALACAS